VTGRRRNAAVALVHLAGAGNQAAKCGGLLGNPGGDLFDVAGDVNDLDPEAGGLTREAFHDFRFSGGTRVTRHRLSLLFWGLFAGPDPAFSPNQLAGNLQEQR
jgi:hypothetical protein